MPRDLAERREVLSPWKGGTCPPRSITAAIGAPRRCCKISPWTAGSCRSVGQPERFHLVVEGPNRNPEVSRGLSPVPMHLAEGGLDVASRDLLERAPLRGITRGNDLPDLPPKRRSLQIDLGVVAEDQTPLQQ